MGEHLFLTTDGGMRKGTAAWAWVAQWRGQTRIVAQQTGIEKDSTNQRAELLAVLNALRWGTDQGPILPHAPITVVSDSAYVVNCFVERWYDKWIRNGWISSSGKPVENKDLWGELIQLALHSQAAVQFAHVRGHRGHPMNEMCDALVGYALDEHFSSPVSTIK